MSPGKDVALASEPAQASRGIASFFRPRDYGLSWGRILLVWLVPALIMSYSTVVWTPTLGYRIEFWRGLLMQVPAWMVMVPATPVIFAFAARFPLLSRPRKKAIAAHAALLLLMAAVYTTVYMWSNVAAKPVPVHVTIALIESIFISSFVMISMLYAVILATSLTMDYARRDRERERRTLTLESQLARAELHTLRAQLHPHVLFNSLHTIALLARRDASEAIRVTVLLGNVLRSVLDSGGTDERALRDEISLIDQYLAIELVRFADRLDVVWQIEPETQEAMVPTLLLQPLIENALRHGIARSINGGTVVVSASRIDQHVCVTVWNEGPSLSGDRLGGAGVGIRNTEERLHRLYGASGSISINNDPRGGVCVRVCVPWHTVDTQPATDSTAPCLGAGSGNDVAGESVADFLVAATTNR
jgi:signal transduction histidine kinase